MSENPVKIDEKMVDELWVEFIGLIIRGMREGVLGNKELVFLYLDLTPLFDHEVFGGEYSADGWKFYCANKNYLNIPRWDLVDERTWNTLCKIDPKFAVMRLLYV